MPTIDELENVVAASDDDMIPVSQNGIVRRVSRSQFLAGTQEAVSITPGLIGRVSPGLGSVQHVAIGNGLSFRDGVLSGSPPYSVGTVPISNAATSSDLVPIWQNGQDHSASVQTLLSASGVEVSRQFARASLGNKRTIGEWLGDVVAVEAFGALGDGMTDDTTALNSAIASGRPVLFGPKTYRVDGQWNIQASTTFVGTIGVTTLRRSVQMGGAWINVTAPCFTSIGIIFDAGSLQGDSWSLLISPTCTRTLIQNCSFLNATGVTLGTGLTIQARDGRTGRGSTHSIMNCNFRNNTCHGLWIQAASGASVSNCHASDNGGFGICLDFNDPQFQNVVRESSITQCQCFNNTRGISVGNYNATNLEPPRWGLDNPDALDITVSGNICSRNLAYGIAVSGSRIQVTQNQVLVDSASGLGSGILCNASLTNVTNNSIVGPGEFGIDAGGCADTSISSNSILNFAMGVNAGGSSRIRIAGNQLLRNSRAITIFQVETDGHGANFGQSCKDIWIEENLIQLDTGAGGVFLLDGPERIEVRFNRFLSPNLDNLQDLCWAHTDSVHIGQNTLNGSTTIEASAHVSQGLVEVTVPEVLDQASLPATTTKVDVVAGLHQATMVGQVSFVRVVSGGRGYSRATVMVTGLGSGASASAYIRDGVIIGVALSAGGSCYDQATTNATIIGDGNGAVLQPTVGLPLPQNKRVSLQCLSPVHFTVGTAAGMLDNWTKSQITVPASSEILLRATAGQWQVTSFASIDYLQPGGDGSVSVVSSAGDIRLNTAAGGGVRFRSDLEQTGFLTYLGRGSPEGVVAAPPGSDYRNLSGGIGSTFWLKRVGNDSSGWFAIA